MPHFFQRKRKSGESEVIKHRHSEGWALPGAGQPRKGGPDRYHLPAAFASSVVSSHRWASFSNSLCLQGLRKSLSYVTIPLSCVKYKPWQASLFSTLLKHYMAQQCRRYPGALIMVMWMLARAAVHKCPVLCRIQTSETVSHCCEQWGGKVYVYIHVYVCVCVCIYICVCVSIYVGVYSYIWIWIYMSMYV